MDVSRRRFFQIAAGAAIAPVAAKIVNPLVPVLWGDGIHDDTSALQALLDGEVVEFANPSIANGAGWFGDTFRMPSGFFKISHTLKIGHKSKCEYNGNHSFLFTTDSQYVFELLDGCTDVAFTNWNINADRDFWAEIGGGGTGDDFRAGYTVA